MTEFQISTSWLAKKGPSELDATMAKLKFIVGDRNVSEFQECDGEKSDHLQIPAYFIAEWIAENWWPLLWEPRKSEDGSDDAEFLARHSLLAAQHGFALPRINFIPTDRTIHITAVARESALTDVRFRNSAQASPLRGVVEKEFSDFVSAVCARLEKFQIYDTGLQEVWRLVRDVGPEERQFCEFAGALGVSPDEISDPTAALLNRLFEKFGGRLLMDLCLVAPIARFDAIASAAEAVFDDLSNVPKTNLGSLLALPVPGDNLSVPPWRRGLRTAQQLRRRFGISDTDSKGATRVFDLLHLDVGQHGIHLSNEEVGLTGAVSRHSDVAKIALVQPVLTQRRFAAARAVFAAWTAEHDDTRFLTSAVTRDQQASRAFAAELTAPVSFLRSRSRNSRLSQDQVFDLAAELQIGSDVVSKQALNNGLRVTAT